jgi:hypothetical protein
MGEEGARAMATAVDLWVMERAGLHWTRAALVEAAPLETARPRDEAHTLELTQNEVIVHAPDGAVLQRIPFDPNELTQFNREFFMTTPDINFDGWPDLTLIASQGLQNVYYDGWIWDTETGLYVYEPEIRELSSPFFNARTRHIETFIHGSATDNESSVWEWRDGRLKEISRRTQVYDDTTGLFTVRTYGLDADGNLDLMEAQTLTEAQLNAD